MKKKVIIGMSILVATLILAVCAIQQFRLYDKHNQEPVHMMLATDLHYLSPKYLREDSFFSKPSAEMDGKLVQYSAVITDAFLREVMEQKPQLLILSGDLTLNGSVQSHTELQEKLAQVQAAGIQVLVIPGNHDVNTAAYDYSKEEVQSVESVLTQGFLEAYAPFGPNQAMSRDAQSFSYIYEVSPYLRILMLDSNCYDRGTVLPATLNWIERELLSAKLAGAEVMMVSHQNLYAHNEKLSFGYQFYNADKLLPLVEKGNIVCNFSGHIHTQSILREDIPEIATAALSLHKAQYGNIIYDGKTLNYKTANIDVAEYAAQEGMTDENLLQFDSYAEEFFKEVARMQVRNRFKDSPLAVEQKELLAETFADINAKFFLGEPIAEADYAAGVALWETQENSFIGEYIKTMLDSGSKNQLSIEIKLR